MDPVVAQIGGVWDRLLDAGYNVWGAVAVSDYHAERLDFPPCSSREPICAFRSGIIRACCLALRAGSFWAGHGGILEDLTFVGVASGLPVPATPGEAVRLSSSARPIFRVKIKRGRNADGIPLAVELIGKRSLWNTRARGRARTVSHRGHVRLATGPSGPGCGRAERLLSRASADEGITRGRAGRIQQPYPAAAREIEAQRARAMRVYLAAPGS